MSPSSSNPDIPETVEEQLLQHKRIALARMGIPLFSTRDGHLATTLAHQQQEQALSESDKIANILDDSSDVSAVNDAAEQTTSAAVAETSLVQPVADGSNKISTPPVTSTSWDKLRADISECTRCPLHLTRQNGVVGDGDPQADWMVIGDAPGADEDARGLPFVGNDGDLLNAMFAALGLTREKNLYIANIIKSRSPNDRDPLPDEIDACWPFLVQQFNMIKPKLVIAVGRVAAHRLLGEELPMKELRGKVHQITIGQLTLPLIVTYHPTYLMRSPSQKAKAWDDMRLAWRCYQQALEAA